MPDVRDELAVHRKATMQTVSALKAIASGISGMAIAAFLAIATVQFAAPPAKATPALAKGKSCKSCHASAKPSKSDVKR
jgi:hypothetical protein